MHSFIRSATPIGLFFVHLRCYPFVLCIYLQKSTYWRDRYSRHFALPVFGMRCIVVCYVRVQRTISFPAGYPGAQSWPGYCYCLVTVTVFHEHQVVICEQGKGFYWVAAWKGCWTASGPSQNAWQSLSVSELLLRTEASSRRAGISPRSSGARCEHVRKCRTATRPGDCQSRGGADRGGGGRAGAYRPSADGRRASSPANVICHPSPVSRSLGGSRNVHSVEKGPDKARWNGTKSLTVWMERGTWQASRGRLVGLYAEVSKFGWRLPMRQPWRLLCVASLFVWIVRTKKHWLFDNDAKNSLNSISFLLVTRFGPLVLTSYAFCIPCSPRYEHPHVCSFDIARFIQWQKCAYPILRWANGLFALV